MFNDIHVHVYIYVRENKETGFKTVVLLQGGGPRRRSGLNGLRGLVCLFVF